MSKVLGGLSKMLGGLRAGNERRVRLGSRFMLSLRRSAWNEVEGPRPPPVPYAAQRWTTRFVLPYPPRHHPTLCLALPFTSRLSAHNHPAPPHPPPIPPPRPLRAVIDHRRQQAVARAAEDCRIAHLARYGALPQQQQQAVYKLSERIGHQFV